MGYRYSTGSNLNTYSALIQNFYSQETAPHQAVHVALNTGTEESEQAGVKAYIRYHYWLLKKHQALILLVRTAHQ